ncbi:mucin-5AC-like [Amphibalanus amphitrite]|uniref:mucin-5AC-like n=1 Tax=Amphibalanus amphitrite TaxID=1232801 RepID=UPI001C912AD5|nr:mucin-5AC-like [Amphibalanus amphitrite]
MVCQNKYLTNGKCHDYEIRLLCWTDECSQLKWSGWSDIDNPSGNCDCEMRTNTRPGCPDGRTPLDIDCRTVRGDHAALTKDLKVVCNVNDGMHCFNKNQPGYVKNSWRSLCLDYKVRYLCGNPYVKPLPPPTTPIDPTKTYPVNISFPITCPPHCWGG